MWNLTKLFTKGCLDLKYFYLINDLQDVWLLIGLSLLSLSASMMVALRCYRRMYPNIKTTSKELTLNPFRLSKYFFNILGKTGLDMNEFVKAHSIFEHVYRVYQKRGLPI